MAGRGVVRCRACRSRRHHFRRDFVAGNAADSRGRTRGRRRGRRPAPLHLSGLSDHLEPRSASPRMVDRHAFDRLVRGCSGRGGAGRCAVAANIEVGMAIGSTGSGVRRVSDPTGVGLGAVLHLRPNPTRLISSVGSGFKLDPWMPIGRLKRSLLAVLAQPNKKP
jgi:hypothetical protein